MVTQEPLHALRVQRLTEHATIPQRATELSAGYDLSSAKAMTVPPNGRAIIPTDLAIACPIGTYGRVAPRSGLTVKKGIHVGAGVIDADYRGSVGVVVFNLGTEPWEIQVGDRIAQLILEEIKMLPVLECESLEDTVRGSGGFGSTGFAKIEEDKVDEAQALQEETAKRQKTNETKAQ